LADFEVPMVRATWFIKMTAAYQLTLTDTKMKKRVTNDPNSGKSCINQLLGQSTLGVY